MEIKNLKNKVEHVLEKYEVTRNSDVALTCWIWLIFHENSIKKIDGKHYIKMEDLKYLPREDNIKRIRAKIQNEKQQFLPTDPDVRKKRKINERKWKRYARHNK